MICCNLVGVGYALLASTLVLTAPENGATYDTHSPCVKEFLANPEKRTKPRPPEPPNQKWWNFYERNAWTQDLYERCEKETKTWKPFTWKADFKTEEYLLEYSETKDFANSIVEKVKGKPMFRPQFLKVGTTYYWRVKAKDEVEDDVVSDVRTFKTVDAFPRMIGTPQWNWRDHGGGVNAEGKRVRQGLIIRTTAPVHAYDDEKATPAVSKALYVGKLGIRSQLELRGEGEAEEAEKRYGRLRLSACGIKVVYHPVDPYYITGATKPEYLAAIRFFANRENYPILYNCAAGSDRTGTIGVLLDGIIGRTDEQIYDDYELPTLNPWVPRLRYCRKGSALFATLAEFGKPTIRENVVEYLTQNGITPEELDAIRKIMVEDVPEKENVPEMWNLDAREKFAAQRFGIFIHWGIYANYAQGEWYLQQKKLDEKAYSRMMHGFCPSKFDAKAWVKVFKDAGAKYVTITSRHHDGFSLWPTKVDDGYNIAGTPFAKWGGYERDILGELSKACDEAGMQLNFYYSLMDWHRRDYPVGSTSKAVLGQQKGDYASYKKFMLGQIGELIARYHPGVIWLDGEWDHAAHRDDGTWARTLDWDFDAIYDFIHARKTLAANNNHQPIREKEDIQLFECDLPGENSGAGFSRNQPIAHDRPVEQCDVIQPHVWGYRIGEKSFRTPEDVCTMICRCAGKDTNLLMNIGPDGSGQLPERAVEVMAAVGQWMAANGDAIYGTRGCGLVKHADGTETAKTQKNGKTYVITLKPGAYPVVK